jgi:hypothetical protein
MKAIFLFFLFLILFNPAFPAYSGDTIPSSKNLSVVKLTNGSSMKGYIISANDSTVSFLTKKDFNRMMFMRQQTIPAEQIEGITKNFKNGFTAAKGMLYGFLFGFGVGFSIGLNNPDDCKDAFGNPVKCDFVDRLLSTKNFGASVIAGGLLGTVGMVIGISTPKKGRVHFNINGSRRNLMDNKTGLNFQQH